MNQIRTTDSSLDPAYEARCEEINTLFDAVHFERGHREQEIFCAVYGDIKTSREHLLPFLKDVGSCPQRVLEHCRVLLAGRET